MANVKNEFVKMDWNADGWYTRSADKWTAFATQVYDGVPVFFAKNRAFLFVDDSTASEISQADVWSASDLASFIGKKSNDISPDDFPEDFDANIIPIGSLFEDEVKTDILEKLGVTNIDSVRADIQNRLNDISPLWEDKDATLQEMMAANAKKNK